jgi:hypothetical protein
VNDHALAAPPRMNSRRFIVPPRFKNTKCETGTQEEVKRAGHVRFGSEADLTARLRDDRLRPKADIGRKDRHIR